MAATNKFRFGLNPDEDDTSFAGANPIQPGLSDLMLGLLAQQRGGGEGGSTVPTANQSSDDDIYNKLINSLTAPATASVQQPTAGLGVTAQEDANLNQATAQGVAKREFGGSPAYGDTFSKLLPNEQGNLTAFPSGGYAVGRTGAQQGAIEADRRAAFAARTDPAAMETRKRTALFDQLQPVDQALMRSDYSRGSGVAVPTAELLARVARGNYEAGQEKKMTTFNRTGRYPGRRVPFSDRDAYRY